MNEIQDKIEYNKDTITLFERAIALGYVPYFQLPFYVKRGVEIETLLVVEWLKNQEGDIAEERKEEMLKGIDEALTIIEENKR
jgi:hypothetical protein|tara:strand:+ start:600 stop:848 length:249 start_codon:yes stop_codon:yes gene_type:complete